MSQINCEACDELREIAPQLLTEGITSKMCTSLQNDTGLNNSLSVLHNDKTDMDYLADCAVGRMAQEIETYDVCDWKEYMSKLVPNIHDVMKATNCVDAGQWKNIHNMSSDLSSLWQFAKDLCAKIEMSLSPSVTSFGTFPFYDDYIDQYPGTAYQMGTINTKNGQQLMIPINNGHRYTGVAGVGIEYAKRKLTDCNNNCQLYEWICPHFFDVQVSSTVEKGDVLWYVSKSEFMEKTGATEGLWTTFTRLTAQTPNVGGGWRWEDNPLGDHRYGWVYLWADPEGMGEDYMVLQWDGTSYPDTGLTTNVNIGDKDNLYLRRSAC